MSICSGAVRESLEMSEENVSSIPYTLDKEKRVTVLSSSTSLTLSTIRLFSFSPLKQLLVRAIKRTMNISSKNAVFFIKITSLSEKSRAHALLR
jgi:hypothetical protein